MTIGQDIHVRPRSFTRREKTSIRQDVKRFEKIGRDHKCVTMADFANFVTDRLKYKDGRITATSKSLIRGLTVYFGEQLLYNTTLARLAVDITSGAQQLITDLRDENPGWLLADRFIGQTVLVWPIVFDYVTLAPQCATSLDDLLDQLIDWNHGYLFRDEIETPWAFGYDLEPEDYLAA